ncbi:acyltransferase family protein [Curtobacterium sp. Leaf261]|uniref:acyltransferase family protein n=1 Tax=Curtobacterium sp. Leaf261 TaxID=1736311 RepID=UPI000A7FE777|nr:acyltransferase family protein [Curtobacterium sp. Leaf261]
MTTATIAAPRAQQQRRRVPLWDTARFVAVILVVIGHSTLKLISGSDPSYALYLFVYAFHIPVFVLISGYFARAEQGVRKLRATMTTVIIPYLVFQTIWSLVHWGLDGELKLDYSSAWWTLWFLVALAIWRIALPYLAILRFPITISLVLSIGIGYVSTIDDTFAAARVVGLLPFFVIGWRLKQWKVADRWMDLGPRDVLRIRLAAVAVFVVVAVLLGVFIDVWRDVLLRRFLLYDESYTSFGYDAWWAGAIRIATIAVALLLSAAFLVLMPRRQTALTAFGQRTLYVYLLHSFLLYPLRESGLLDGHHSVWVLVAVVLLSVGIAVLLGLPFVKTVFRPLVEPRLDWLFVLSRKQQRGGKRPGDPAAPDPVQEPIAGVGAAE